MESKSKFKRIKGYTRRIWNVSRVPIRLRPTMLGILAVMSLVSVGCPPKRIGLVVDENDILAKGMLVCTEGYRDEVKIALIAKFEDLKKGGTVEWKAAREAGSVLLPKFTDDTKRLEAYKAYLECMKPFIDKDLSVDKRPKVVLVGSKEDYTNYKLEALEATSVALLRNKVDMNFKVAEFIVDYWRDCVDLIREEKPAVVVMHASAFHHDEYKDEAVDKFQAVVTALYYGLPKTKFVVFSRMPGENPPQDLCQRWKRQVNFLQAKKFRDRLIFYPLLREESNFTGKAGIEISEIIRCLSGLENTGYSSIYLRVIKKEAQKRIALVRKSRCR